MRTREEIAFDMYRGNVPENDSKQRLIIVEVLLDMREQGERALAIGTELRDAWRSREYVRWQDLAAIQARVRALRESCRACDYDEIDEGLNGIEADLGDAISRARGE